MSVRAKPTSTWVPSKLSFDVDAVFGKDAVDRGQDTGRVDVQVRHPMVARPLGKALQEADSRVTS